MSYLNKSQQEAKQKHLNNQNIHKQRMREKKGEETWEAKQFRIKQTAERVNKNIGLC